MVTTKKRFDSNQFAFLALLQAGLWETDARLIKYKEINYLEVLRLSEEQAVVGLIATGLEHVVDVKVPKEQILQFVGQTIQLERRNAAMNLFLGQIVSRLRDAGIYTLLVKGQGVAQCYERPLRRTCGDIDLFHNEVNYQKAKDYLLPLSSSYYQELQEEKHFQITINSWSVELHGNLPCHLSKKVDNFLKTIQEETLEKGNVRLWDNNGVDIFLPEVNNDIIFSFTHILKHFFYGGIGLRQICDWCRLIWKYNDRINIDLLRERLKIMGLRKEWEAFAFLAVNTLGMPEAKMPLYTSSNCARRESDLILNRVFETGNFGVNFDTSYQRNYPFLIRKAISWWRHTSGSAKLIIAFPKNASIAWWKNMIWGVKEVVKK